MLIRFDDDAFLGDLARDGPHTFSAFLSIRQSRRERAHAEYFYFRLCFIHFVKKMRITPRFLLLRHSRPRCRQLNAAHSDGRTDAISFLFRRHDQRSARPIARRRRKRWPISASRPHRHGIEMNCRYD